MWLLQIRSFNFITLHFTHFEILKYENYAGILTNYF
jgi:hypothetical protein